MRLEDIQAWLSDKDTKRVAQVAAQYIANPDNRCGNALVACRQTFRMRRHTPTTEQLYAAVHLLEQTNQ